MMMDCGFVINVGWTVVVRVNRDVNEGLGGRRGVCVGMGMCGFVERNCGR